MMKNQPHVKVFISKRMNMCFYGKTVNRHLKTAPSLKLSSEFYWFLLSGSLVGRTGTEMG